MRSPREVATVSLLLTVMLTQTAYSRACFDLNLEATRPVYPLEVCLR